MTELSQRKFTAELNRHQTARRPAHASAVASEAQPEMMLAIVDLQQRLAEIRDLIVAGNAAGPAPAPTPAMPETQDASYDAVELQDELHALQIAINQTKHEIAALRQMGKPPAHLQTATNELDAVVHATESATECILAASEQIDTILMRLRNQTTDADEIAVFDEIGEQVTRIFESCNFQDITGQRITKVVNALKFVEDRVERMIVILGGTAAIAEVVTALPEEVPEDDESHLLEGPQLAQSTNKVSQDDIDRFFS